MQIIYPWCSSSLLTKISTKRLSRRTTAKTWSKSPYIARYCPSRLTMLASSHFVITTLSTHPPHHLNPPYHPPRIPIRQTKPFHLPSANTDAPQHRNRHHEPHLFHLLPGSRKSMSSASLPPAPLFPRHPLRTMPRASSSPTSIFSACSRRLPSGKPTALCFLSSTNPALSSANRSKPLNRPFAFIHSNSSRAKCPTVAASGGKRICASSPPYTYIVAPS